MRNLDRIIATVVAVACLGACSNANEELARKALYSQLSDPESAEFRNVRKIENGDICGEVNAKNQYGTYQGYRVFVASGTGSGGVVESPELAGSMAQELFLGKCRS